VNVWLYVWRVPGRRVPAVAWRMARDRGRLRRTPGVSFAKLLGTGRDRRFGPTSTDPTRWAALVVTEQAPELERWQKLASAECRLQLRPLASRGRWSGREPFQPAEHKAEGEVLALTRARLRPSRAVRFWRAARAPGLAAGSAPGLLAAFGVGEAPLGVQGTISVWRSDADLVQFAYRHPDHQRVIDRTPAERWYAEELFARFAVLGVSGDPDVIGWSYQQSAQRRAA
jgi:hypothetical protein